MNIGFDKIGLSSYLAYRMIVNSNNDGNVIGIKVMINNTVIYETTLCGVNGMADFFDLDCLVSEYMRNNGICLGRLHISCSFTHTMQSIESWVVYSSIRSSYEIPADFLRHHFLSTRSYYTIPRGKGINLNFVIHQDDNELPNGVLNFSFVFDNGRVHSDSFNLNLSDKKQTSLYTYFLSEAAILYHLQLRFPGRNVKVLSGSVCFGHRHMDFYFVDDLPVETFSFLNAFNCWETFFVFGSQSIKTDFSQKLGLLSGRVVNFGQTSERKVQVETVPLALEVAEWLNQFLGSPCVIKTLPPDDDQKVVLSDIDSVISDSAKDMVQLKFSWAFSEPYVWRVFEDFKHPFNSQYNDSFQ